MAFDSVFGADREPLQQLSDISRAILESFLNDTQLSPIAPPVPVGAATIPGGLSFTGLGADNEVQMAFILAGDSNSQIDLSANLGSSLLLNASVGGGSVLTVEGPEMIEDNSAFLRHVVDTAIGGSAPGAAELRASLNQAIDFVGNDSPGQVVRVVQIMDNQSGVPTVLSASNLLPDVPLPNVTFGLNLNHTSSPVIVDGLASVVIAGAGHVSIAGGGNTIIAADLRDQVIVGGTGNETIVGGGGHDTIFGGGGNNVFVITTNVHTGGGVHSVTIGDFTDNDILRFTSYSDLDDLKSNLTRLDGTSNGVSASFADGSVVILLGISIDQLHADLFDFG